MKSLEDFLFQLISFLTLFHHLFVVLHFLLFLFLFIFYLIIFLKEIKENKLNEYHQFLEMCKHEQQQLSSLTNFDSLSKDYVLIQLYNLVMGIVLLVVVVVVEEISLIQFLKKFQFQIGWIVKLQLKAL